MAELKKLVLEDHVSILDEEDESTLAAIDRATKAANEGWTVTIEEARQRIREWSTRSSSPKTR